MGLFSGVSPAGTLAVSLPSHTTSLAELPELAELLINALPLTFHVCHRSV